MKYFIGTLFAILSAAPCYSQVTLADVFADLNSPDPKTRDAANRISVETFEHEIPFIERDASALCHGLTSRQDVARQDASGMLTVLAQLYPQKVGVVSACLPQLLQTASDPVDQIKENSLTALVLKAGGPPQAAAPLFTTALNDTNTAIRQIAANGILRLPAGTNQESVKLLADRITAEQNPEVKQALLLGAVQSLKTNPEIALAASRLIVDVSPDVKAAAILAVENLNSDKARAQTELQNYQNSPLLSRDDKARIEEAVTRLQTTTH